VTPERPFVDGRRTAVFVLNELRVDGGQLTQMWLARLRAFAEAGWATHAAHINKNPQLDAVVATLVDAGQMPADTVVHHYAKRDRGVRASWYGRLPEGVSADPRVGDWLDWLTGQIPGAVVFADSPAAYPYLAHMSNPLIARVAGIHVSHLAAGARGTDPISSPLAPRFEDRFAPWHGEFDALVVPTAAQAADLRARFGEDLPLVTIPPAVPAPHRPAAAAGPSGADADDADRPGSPVPPGVRRIVATAPLEPGSHHEDAIRAFHAVAGTHPDAVLQIVGEGDIAAELESLAGELGLSGRVWIIPPGPDPDAPFPGAAATVWTGRREALPQVIVRSLHHGVPVVARDVKYGPVELLTDPELGDLVCSTSELAEALDRRLRAGHDPEAVRASAAPLLRRTDPAEVGARWVALAHELADGACDHRSPSLLVESVNTNARVLRMPGILADSGSSLAAWSCELPGLVEPAGWLTEATRTAPGDDDEEQATHPHAAGPTREVVVQLRSNALAFVVTETGEPIRLDFTDGAMSAPLLTTAFQDRVIASRVGNAILARRPDGTVWVTPLPELVYASNVDGRLFASAEPGGTPSDITHAVSWGVDIAWSDMRATPQGAAFTGILRAVGIAPAEGSVPSICVPDVGGYSRVVGELHYLDEPTATGQEWAARVGGVIEVDALTATTTLARHALSMHVGFRGLLVPVGGLWTHGQRSPIHLACPRGEVTLLPSPGGRILAAPGKGYRARASGVARALVRRG
jgi:glycosyltransferase involved in cell wall biosynthesis